MAQVIKAPALNKGDRIALIAPASAPIAEERVTKAVKYFETLGYRVVVGKHAYDTRGFLAGTDKDRISDLHTAFRDPRIKAIFCIRGGYGSIRMLPDIDYDLIRRNPKILVGYSDITALINAIYKKTGLCSLFFGPMPGVDIWDEFDEFAEANLWQALSSSEPLGDLPMDRDEGILLNRGKGEDAAVGKIIGGNMAVLSSICGTPFEPKWEGGILCLEEVDERPYRIDRYLAQLRAMGVFQKVSAIVLGQFPGCAAPEGTPSLTIEEIFADYFTGLDIPVMSNTPFGHVSRQWTLPYGAWARVTQTITRASLEIVDGALS